MNIVIITSIMLPMPPVKGGAVQNLIKLFLDDNEKTNENTVHVFSFYDSEAEIQASEYKATTFHYIKNTTFLEKIQELNVSKVSRAAVLVREKIYINSVLKCMDANDELKNCDIILLENCPQFSIQIKKKFSSKMLYCHLHNDYINHNSRNALPIIQSLDKIICVSDYIGKQVISVSKNANVVTLHNGVSAKEADKRKVKLIKDRYITSQNESLVIFTGRLIPDKGAHVLLEAYSKMKNKDKCSILFLGSQLYGKNVEDEYLKKLREMSKMYGKHIHFTGYIPYEEISSYYTAADIGVIPSLWEDPCPLTVIECLRYGVPVITTDSGGIPEIVDEKCSFVLHRDETLSQHIADCLDKLTDDSHLVQEMSREALKRSEKFTEECYLEHLKNIVLDTERLDDGKVNG